jgi:hypothetical protein
MKRLLMLTLAVGLAGMLGCEQKSGTAPSTNPDKPGEVRKITLTASEDHTITQGQTDDVMVTVTRSHHQDPVTLEVSDLPTGVTVDSKDLTVPGDKHTLTLRLKADPTAPPVKDHVFHIVGKAADMKSDALNMKLTVKAKS